MDAHILLSDPAWFLASVDLDTKQLSFVKTSEDKLHSAPFLDGRTSIGASDEVISVPLKKALEAYQPDDRPDRLIAHMSFCGSTYLSRTIEGAGEALCYREPHTLVELASLKALGHPISKNREEWMALLRLVLGQYRKPWPTATSLVKPSNWANTLLSDLIEASSDMKLVSLEFDVKAYLVANLRGGRDRLQYSLNLLNHFLSANSAYRGDVLRVERAQLPPMQRLLRLLVIVYETQKQLLDQAVQAASGHRFVWSCLSQKPSESLPRIAKALDVTLPTTSIEAALTKEEGRHAKNKAETYTPDQEAARNAEILSQFETDIREALNWRQTELGLAA